MTVYTGNPRFASGLLPREIVGRLAPAMMVEPGLEALLETLMGEPGQLLQAPARNIPWTHLLLTEFSSSSNYDQLIELARKRKGLPDRLVSLVGSGLGFHGFKGRPWAALPGNIHLAVHFTPNQPVERFEIAFTILAAVSVAEALEELELPGVTPGIKWVNDILLGEGKVAGVLAYTQTQEGLVNTAVLGIGVNVEATPEVEPTPFVPSVTSVREHLPSTGSDAREPLVMALLAALDRNYRSLLGQGPDSLLEKYIRRSLVVGKEVTICTENSDRSLQALATGRVLSIGDHLELFLEGRTEPVRSGRLALGSVTEDLNRRMRGPLMSPRPKRFLSKDRS